MIFIRMNISASILILVIIVIRAFAIYKVPKLIFRNLWYLPIIRLTFPIFISFSWLNPISENAIFITAESFVSINGNILNKTFVIYIWLIGVIIVAGLFILPHIRYRRICECAPLLENKLLINIIEKFPLKRTLLIKQVDTDTNAACTYGIFRPVIVLPNNTKWSDKQQIKYILVHELMHIKHLDIAFKWFLAAMLCIYWFNPFVWLMFIFANRDVELACDEAVVKFCGYDNKADYAKALIALEEIKTHAISLSNGFSKNSIEERIVSIMKIKRATFGIVILAITLMGLLIIMGFTKGESANLNENIAIYDTLIEDSTESISNDDSLITYIPK